MCLATECSQVGLFTLFAMRHVCVRKSGNVGLKEVFQWLTPWDTLHCIFCRHSGVFVISLTHVLSPFCVETNWSWAVRSLMLRSRRHEAKRLRAIVFISTWYFQTGMGNFRTIKSLWTKILLLLYVTESERPIAYSNNPFHYHILS